MPTSDLPPINPADDFQDASSSSASNTPTPDEADHDVPDGALHPGEELMNVAETGDSTRAPISRVIDVPLRVTLRFGQRQLTVRELLELNTGSLVELDQQVEEPVYLMLGERVLARGEVVIVDGNYGMRVLEVVEHPAAQRLLL